MSLLLNPIKKTNFLKQGILISFEGIDGSGKTSVIETLKTYFENYFNTNLTWNGYSGFITTFEPGGGSKNALVIRDLVLNPPSKKRIHPLTEAFLFAAARNENLEHLILPNLAKNKIVITDRFVDSSLVYQGLMTELGFEKVSIINNFVFQKVKISLTFFLYTNKKDWIKRMQNRKQKNVLDKIEFETLNQKYQTVFKKNLNRKIVFINTNNSQEKILEIVLSEIKKIC